MKKSAGILAYKMVGNALMIFLVHPGGPFWKNKDNGSWSIPKGEFDDIEDPLAAALREFEEETGIALQGKFEPLQSVRLKSRKTIYAWASEQVIHAETIASNTFELEWPPKSGKMRNVPEIDRAEWFPAAIAMEKINAAQTGFIVELQTKLGLKDA